jgi:hypothetical protein
VTFYEVVITSGAGNRAEQVETLTAVVDGLTPNTESRIDVVAWNESGGGKAQSTKLKTAKAPRAGAAM